VLAGWTLGGVWALLCWMVMVWLQKRGDVEAETANLVEEPGNVHCA
jgi:undecaprenyl-diphosphatase